MTKDALSSPYDNNKPKGLLFTEKGKVAAWVSQTPYSTIPDAYFEEKFSKNNTRANNEWSDNYQLAYFNPDNIETNGSLTDVIDIERAAGECSFSCSFIEAIKQSAKEKDIEGITWLILLYDSGYNHEKTGVTEDEHTTFLGEYSYDYGAKSLYDIEDSAINLDE